MLLVDISGATNIDLLTPMHATYVGSVLLCGMFFYLSPATAQLHCSAMRAHYCQFSTQNVEVLVIIAGSCDYHANFAMPFISFFDF